MQQSFRTSSCEPSSRGSRAYPGSSTGESEWKTVPSSLGRCGGGPNAEYSGGPACGQPPGVACPTFLAVASVHVFDVTRTNTSPNTNLFMPPNSGLCESYSGYHAHNSGLHSGDRWREEAGVFAPMLVSQRLGHARKRMATPPIIQHSDHCTAPETTCGRYAAVVSTIRFLILCVRNRMTALITRFRFFCIAGSTVKVGTVLSNLRVVTRCLSRRNPTGNMNLLKASEARGQFSAKERIAPTPAIVILNQ